MSDPDLEIKGGGGWGKGGWGGVSRLLAKGEGEVSKKREGKPTQCHCLGLILQWNLSMVTFNPSVFERAAQKNQVIAVSGLYI